VNSGYDYIERLDTRANGQTVLEYLSGRYRHSTAECWRERVLAGRVSLDGVVAVPGQVLRQGQILCWSRPAWIEPEVPLNFAVIHEDDDLLVVSKPSGLPSAPAGGFLAHTLLSLVREQDPRWAPMHRLGRGTSGLVVFARAPEARCRLQAAWREGGVERRYRALATGSMPDAPLTITAPIGPVEHPLLGWLHSATPEGRPAHTEVRRLALRAGNSLVEIRIATGRTHQIRIHLAFAGYPLVGDPLYGEGGRARPETTALPGDLGYQLHAWQLAFEHPRTRTRIEFEAPTPPGLA
jgi:23S rRNA pseudouridine1911/1915/1917 synthase